MDILYGSYSAEDKDYKKKVYVVSYSLSGLGFFLIYLVSLNLKDIIGISLIIVLLILIGGIFIIRQRKINKKVKSKFDNILEEITVYSLICIVISSISVFIVYPLLLGVFIASIFGLLTSIDGILFNSKCRKVGGLLLILSSLIMLLYLKYQFLILSVVQFIIAIMVYLCKDS